MQVGNNVKMAIASLKSSKWRSVLTMLGIIIGVASVVTTVSLGLGVRQQIVGQTRHVGQDLITIRPGNAVNRGSNGEIKSVNIRANFSPGNISEGDYYEAKSVTGVGQISPFSLVGGEIKADGRQYDDGFIVATTEVVPSLLNQRVEYGSFFSEKELDKPVVVIGQQVAQDLFRENVPVGRIIQLRGQSFAVRGVFEKFDSSPLAPNSDYNTAIFIPFDTAKQLKLGQTQIYQILAKPNDPKQAEAVAGTINKALLAIHNNQPDFTVLNQDEVLAIANKVFALLTGLISSVAAISLLVGGIGIMNILFVSVTERTREIGVRKAVGATNRQILNQFMTEAAVLSIVGGALGVIVSILANYLIRIFTDLVPIITIPVMIVAVGMALVIGVFFGIAPAVKAARKDPIESLRYE